MGNKRKWDTLHGEEKRNRGQKIKWDQEAIKETRLIIYPHLNSEQIEFFR